MVCRGVHFAESFFSFVSCRCFVVLHGFTGLKVSQLHVVPLLLLLALFVIADPVLTCGHGLIVHFCDVISLDDQSPSACLAFCDSKAIDLALYTNALRHLRFEMNGTTVCYYQSFFAATTMTSFLIHAITVTDNDSAFVRRLNTMQGTLLPESSCQSRFECISQRQLGYQEVSKR